MSVIKRPSAAARVRGREEIETINDARGDAALAPIYKAFSPRASSRASSAAAAAATTATARRNRACVKASERACAAACVRGGEIECTSGHPAQVAYSLTPRARLGWP